MTTENCSQSKAVKVGIIGAGVISATYIENLQKFADVELVAIGDLFAEAAKKRAEEYNIPFSGDTESVLNHPDIELIINLTIPAAHAEVAIAALNAGKNVFNEKPLALDLASADKLLKISKEKNLKVGCAPDTFLGEGLQRSFNHIRSGKIGEPVFGRAAMMSPGPESWHPNPEFLYQKGAGPLFDIGPYYLTTMVQIFGSIKEVAAINTVAKPIRTIGSGPKAGQTFETETPTHVSAIIRFESGAHAHLTLSFDSPLIHMGEFVVTGTKATLDLPDPNNFDGKINIANTGDWGFSALEETVEKSSRGTGALEMARSLRTGKAHRASMELAYHVLEAMTAIAKAGETNSFVPVTSSVHPAPLLPEDWDPKAATNTAMSCSK